MTDDQTPEDERTSEDEEQEMSEEQQTEEDAAEDEEPQREELVAEPAGTKAPPSPTEPDVVEKSSVVTGIAVIVAIAIVAIGAWAIMNMRRPEANELLQETLAKYQNAENIHVESTMSYEMSMGDQTDDAQISTTAWFSRPNKMLLVSGDENNNTTAVSDGESLYLGLSFGPFPGAIKLPAPPDLAQMPLDRLSVSAATGMQGYKLPDIASIISGAFSMDSIGSVEYGIAEGNEWLASLESPAGTWALTVQSENGPALAMWIDRGRIVRKYAALIDYDAVAAATPQIEEQIQTLPEERQQAIRQMETRLVATVEIAEFRQKPPEDTFVFEPEEGTVVVEAQTIDEGVQKLMTEMMSQQSMPGGPPPQEAPTPDQEQTPDEGGGAE